LPVFAGDFGKRARRVTVVEIRAGSVVLVRLAAVGDLRHRFICTYDER
jgi:hypothetical protein